MYPIPTWLQPADLPSAYAKGLAIGAQIGEQQTRTRLAEAEMLRRNEEAAQEQAYRDSVMALKTQEQLRSAKAQDEYRRLVQGGMEPMKALQMLGPSLGMTDTAMVRAAMPQPAAFQPQAATVDGTKLIQVGPQRWIPAPVPTETQTGPVQARPVIGPNGAPLPNRLIVPTSRTGSQLLDLTPQTVKASQQESSARAMLNAANAILSNESLYTEADVKQARDDANEARKILRAIMKPGTSAAIPTDIGLREPPAGTNAPVDLFDDFQNWKQRK